MKFFYTSEKFAIVLAHVAAVGVTASAAERQCLTIWTADSPDPVVVDDKEIAQRFCRETGFAIPDGHPWSLPASRVRRFTHSERFDDDTVYTEFFPDGRVELVSSAGRRTAISHWTLSGAIENAKRGDWIELPVS